MNPPEINDPLGALLGAPDNHIQDGGFIARVMAALPRRCAWLRPALMLATTVIGSLLAAWWLPWKDLSLFGPSVLLLLNSQVLLPRLLLVAAVASLVVGAMVAFQRED